MIKVSELKKRGIEIVVGDEWSNTYMLTSGVITQEDVEIIASSRSHDDVGITEFSERPIHLGMRPEKSDFVVELRLDGDEIANNIAKDVFWDAGDIISWMPSMEHLIEDIKCESNIKQYVKGDMNSKLKGFNDSDYIDGANFYQRGSRVKDNKAAADFLISKAAPYYVSMSNNTDDTPTEGDAEVIDNCYSGIKIKDPQKILNASAVSVSSAIDSVDAAITTLTSMGYTFHGGTHWKPPLGVKPVFANGVKWTPVFTKEMADAGDLPPVGSSCLVFGDADKGEGDVLYNCEILKHRGLDDGLMVAIFLIKNYQQRDNYYSHCSARYFKPLPTERDLITDDLEDIIASQGHLNKANITNQIANLIYDAGYRKSDK